MASSNFKFAIKVNDISDYGYRIPPDMPLHRHLSTMTGRVIDALRLGTIKMAYRRIAETWAIDNLPDLDGGEAVNRWLGLLLSMER